MWNISMIDLFSYSFFVSLILSFTLQHCPHLKVFQLTTLFTTNTEVKLPALIGNLDGPTNRQTDRPGHGEVSIPMMVRYILIVHH